MAVGAPTWRDWFGQLWLVTLSVGIVTSSTREAILSRSVDSLMLDQHNAFRQEERASNIFKMHWNASAVTAARRWARGCQFKHELAGTFSENLFYSSTADRGEEKEVLLSGLQAWHDEKLTWSYSSASCGAACHYTQMVWSSTTSVGCAYEWCPILKVGSRQVPNALYLACFYWPRGNWVGEYPFKKGSTCSSCGSGSCEDGLCVEVAVSSYHKNEVRSQSSYSVSYDSRGQPTRRQSAQSRSAHSESALNVTRTSPRHRSHHHVRHSQSRHESEGRDVILSPQHQPQTRSSYRSSYSSRRVESHSSAALGRDSLDEINCNVYERRSSYSSRRVESHSSARRGEAPPEALRQREVTYASGSGAGALRELQKYSPSRSRLPTPRQTSRAAQYARTAVEPRRRDRVQLQRDRGRTAATRRRQPSPLDVVRADTFWCRDRLPSCRSWATRCLKSKVVYMSCPRTCGHCGKKAKSNYSANESVLRQRPTPRPPTQRSSQRRRPGQSLTPPSKVQSRRPSQRGGNRTGGRAAEERRRKRLERQRVKEEKRRKRTEARKRRRQDRRRRMNPKYKAVDRRAERLAESLRQDAAARGERCEDDPHYTRTCPVWTRKGFCDGNELVENVYCRKSCGSC